MTEAERHEIIRANMLAAEAWPEGTTANELTNQNTSED